MSLVECKCKNCCGVFTVDSGLKTANCPFCGSAFDVQDTINYFNSTEVQNVKEANDHSDQITEQKELYWKLVGQRKPFEASYEETRNELQALSNGSGKNRAVNLLVIGGIMFFCGLLGILIGVFYDRGIRNFIKVTGNASSGEIILTGVLFGVIGLIVLIIGFIVLRKVIAQRAERRALSAELKKLELQIADFDKRLAELSSAIDSHQTGNEKYK